MTYRDYIQICLLILITLILVYYFIIITINTIFNSKLQTMYNKYAVNKSTIDKHKFVQNICNNIKFYKNNNYTPNTLPIITKKMIHNNPDLFYDNSIAKITESVNSTENNWNHLKSHKNINMFDFVDYAYRLYNGHAISNVTGGSSGNYFYQWFTLKEYEECACGFVKCWINMGWKPSEKIFVYYFHGANAIKLLNKISLSNIIVSIPKMTPAGDITEESVYEFVNILNNDKPDLIVSFPSTIFRVAQLIYQNDIKIIHKPKYMDLSADLLFTCQYRFIKSIFDTTDIRLSYGTIEFGQIAQQIPGTMFDYVVFDDVVDVENDSNNNLIVSNYFLTTQPMLRYLTDDNGIVKKEKTRTIIKNLVGKTDENHNYIEIDNYIESYKNNSNIINLRIDSTNNIVHITVLYSDVHINEYFHDYFYSHSIVVNICSKKSCKTHDRFDRKNTPILKQHFFVK